MGFSLEGVESQGINKYRREKWSHPQVGGRKEDICLTHRHWTLQTLSPAPTRAAKYPTKGKGVAGKSDDQRMHPECVGGGGEK